MVSPTSKNVMLTTSYRCFHNSCTFEMGLSAFHKIIVTVKKTHFQKKEPKIIQYRDYSNYSAEEFPQDIQSFLSSWDLTKSIFDTFMTKCKDTFENKVLLKLKYLRSNQSPFINKRVWKVIMDWTKLRNRVLRTSFNGDKGAYNKQWN